jgi:hypothetical protein
MRFPYTGICRCLFLNQIGIWVSCLVRRHLCKKPRKPGACRVSRNWCLQRFVSLVERVLHKVFPAKSERPTRLPTSKQEISFKNLSFKLTISDDGNAYIQSAILKEPPPIGKNLMLCNWRESVFKIKYFQALYSKIEKKILSGLLYVEFKTKTLEECAEICTNKTVSDGCLSFDWCPYKNCKCAFITGWILIFNSFFF